MLILERHYSKLTAILKAHQSIVEQLRENEQLAVWLDRKVEEELTTVELQDGDGETLAANLLLLETLYEQLPILVSSRSTERRVSVEGRFGWRTLREVRLDFLRATLEKLTESEVDDILAEQRGNAQRSAGDYDRRDCTDRDLQRRVLYRELRHPGDYRC